MFYCKNLHLKFISNPWLCLPLEVLKALTSQFFFIASCRFCSETAPIGLLATLNGIQHACNFSIGFYAIYSFSILIA